MAMVCINCDAPLPEGAVFCAKCGHRVATAAEPGATPATSDIVQFALPPLSQPPSRRRMHLPWFAPMAVVLLAVGVYFIVQHQTAGWQVSLRANWTSVGTGSTVHLTATTNKKVDGSGNFITIKDADTGAQVAMCQQGDTCTADVTQNQAESQGFVATIGDVAHSSSVRVAWLDWNLQLSTNKTEVTPGTAVKLSASATGAIDFSRYDLAILDSTSYRVVKDCGHSASCTVQLSQKTEQQDKYFARVSDARMNVAESTPVTVAWAFTRHVALKVDWSSVGAGSTVHLTATTNRTVDGSPYPIMIADSTGSQIAVCREGRTCTADVTQSQAISERYVATIGNVAHSAGVPVVWNDWGLQLTADQTRIQAGGTVTLSAQANSAIDFARYDLSIVETATSQTVKDCGHTSSCTTQLSRQAEEGDNFAVHVADANGEDIADSDPVTVSWTFQWTITNQNSGTGNNLNAVSFSDTNTGWAVGDNGTILNTMDGGATWGTEQSGTGDNLNAVSFSDADNGWAVGDFGTILHTTDGGSTWTAQASGVHAAFNSITFTDLNTGWIGGRGGAILHTTDGGATWVIQQSGTSDNINGVAFVNATTGWAVSDAYEDGRSHILYTSDGGLTWADQLSNGLVDQNGYEAALNSVRFTDPNTGWVVGTGGAIFHTTDGGTTWDAQPSAANVTLLGVTFPQAGSGWIVGAAGTILHTTDGTTWSREQSGTANDLHGVAFGDEGNGWAVGAGGTILHITGQ